MSKFSELINGPVPVLVDFFAEWCGPCKTMGPILSDTAKNLGDKVKVIKVDIDKNPAAANHYEVRSVPTLMLFHKGEIKWKQAGVVPGAQLEEVIGQIIRSNSNSA